MTAPPKCPQAQNFSVLTGFLTPGSDTGPGALDGSISLDVLDPTEGNEKVRAVEVTDPWNLEVDWCVCGRFADMLCGCWCVQVFIDDIDGVGPTHGRIGAAKVSVDSGTRCEGEDTAHICFEHTFHFPADTVKAGVYDLVVSSPCPAATVTGPSLVWCRTCWDTRRSPSWSSSTRTRNSAQARRYPDRDP